MPALFVPMRFPWTVVAVVPDDRRIPLFPFAETTLATPAKNPPITVPDDPATSIPFSPLPRLMLVVDTPIMLCQTVLLGDAAPMYTPDPSLLMIVFPSPLP